MRMPPGWMVYPIDEIDYWGHRCSGWMYAPTGQHYNEPWGEWRNHNWVLTDRLQHYGSPSDARPSRRAAMRALRAHLRRKGEWPTRPPSDYERAPLRGWLLLLMKTKCARDHWAATGRYLLW